MRVVVPPQSVDRDDDNWLYHRTVPKGILYYRVAVKEFRLSYQNGCI